jgi:hypothetical protein
MNHLLPYLSFVLPYKNPISHAKIVNNLKNTDTVHAHYFSIFELSLIQLVLNPDQQGFLLDHIQLVNLI